MGQILDFISNNGFAIVMCLLLFFKLLPRMDKMEKTVAKDSENTAKVEKSIDTLNDTINNHLVHAINKLTSEVSRLNGKK